MNHNVSNRERFSEAEHSYFASYCLKRKLEIDNDSVWNTNNEILGQEYEDCPVNGKRLRISATSNPGANGAESFTTVSAQQKLFQNFHNTCKLNLGVAFQLPNNLESTVVGGVGENIEMEVESSSLTDVNSCSLNSNETEDCTGNLPTKTSPAREFLRRHRPDCMIHCIPSYCHPGGLWDAMMEVYHGI